MDKEELLRALTDLSNDLGELPSVSSDTRIGNMWNLYKDARKKMTNYKLYGEIDSKEADAVKVEILDLKQAKEPLDKEVSNIEAAIAWNNEKYAANLREMEDRKEELSKPNLSIKKREDAEDAIDDAEKAMSEIVESRAETNKKLAEAREKQEKLNKQIAEKETELQEIYKTVSDKIALDAQTLYFAYDFFASNPKEEIQNTIDDYKDGVIDLATLNERLQNLKALLNSGLYDINDVNRRSVERRKREHDERKYAELEKFRKVNNIEFYEKKRDEYQKRVNEIMALIQSTKGEDLKLKNLKNELSFCEAIVKREEFTITYLNQYGEGIKELEDISALSNSYDVTEMINKKAFSKELDFLIQKTGGEHLVEKKGRQVPNYFPEEYLQLLDEATKEETNRKVHEEITKAVEKLPEEERQDAIKEARNAAKKAVREVKEEQKKKESEIPVIEPNNEEKGLVPLDGPKVEVKNVKDNPKLLKKVREWFDKNWKTVAVLGGHIALCVLLLCSSCKGKKVKDADAKARSNEKPPVKEFVIEDKSQHDKYEIPGLDLDDKKEETPVKEFVIEDKSQHDKYEIPGLDLDGKKEETPVATPTPTAEPTTKPTVKPTPVEEDKPMDGRVIVNPEINPNDKKNQGGDSLYAKHPDAKAQLGGGTGYGNVVVDTSISGQKTFVELEDPTTGKAKTVTVYSDGTVASKESTQDAEKGIDFTPVEKPVEKKQEEVPTDAISSQEYMQKVEEENKKLEEKKENKEITAEQAEKEIAENLAERNALLEAMRRAWEEEPTPGKAK